MNYEIWRWKEADDDDDDVDTAEDDVLFGVTFIGILAQDNSTNQHGDWWISKWKSLLTLQHQVTPKERKIPNTFSTKAFDY